MTVKISALSAASALGGTEKIECVQSSTSLYLTPAQIETYIAGLGRTFAKDAGLMYVLAHSSVAVNCPADTSEDTLATVTVPAGAMGANGLVRVTTLWTVTNNANAKSLYVRFGGTSGTQFLAYNAASTNLMQNQVIIRNRNSQSSQVGFYQSQPNSFSNPGSGAIQTAAIDTSASADIVIRAQKATAGDTVTLESYLVELYYKA